MLKWSHIPIHDPIATAIGNNNNVIAICSFVVSVANEIQEVSTGLSYIRVYVIIRHDAIVHIIIIIMNFYSPVSNTRCHSIGHKMRIARIKIRVDSQGRWERA